VFKEGGRESVGRTPDSPKLKAACRNSRWRQGLSPKRTVL